MLSPANQLPLAKNRRLTAWKLRRLGVLCHFWGVVCLTGRATTALYDAPRGPLAAIVQQGQASAQIVTPAQPSALEEYAAAELQTYVNKISGAKLPVVKEGRHKAGRYSIFLGNTRKAAAAGVLPDAAKMGWDGFAWRSVRGGLAVRGRNDLGTLFGVYELLERHFGVRWFMPGEIGEDVPKRDTLVLGTLDLTFKPSFRVRRIGEGEWALRQRMNTFVTAGGRRVGINWKWHFHTFALLMPPAEYYAKHPEYFALVKGQRRITDSPTHENQLCTSNPEVIREIARKLIATLDAEPDIEIIALSPNDGGGFCECSNCVALDEPGRDWFAKYSRRLAIFNNQVAKLVGQKYPRVKIKVGAYAMYARPPLDDEFRPETNLLYQLCHLYFCHNHPLGSDACRSGRTYQASAEFQPNQEFGKILDQWRRLSPELFVYEYYSIGGMAKAGLPWPVVHTIRADIPYYRDHGAQGFFTQLSPELWHRLGLNYYVAAKLCWNADLNVDALLADYFARFYGPAAGAMRDYFLAMEHSMQDWNGCVSYGLQGVSGMKAIGPKIFTPEVMQQMAASLEAAERLAAGDELLTRRVSLARRMYSETQQALAAINGDTSSAATTKPSPALRIVSRTISAEQPGLYNALYLGQSGYRLRAGDRVSEDNARTWKKSPMTPDFDAGLPHGYRRNEVTSVVDPAVPALLTLVNALDTPGLDPNVVEPPVALENWYLRYRVSTDGGTTWLFDEPIVGAGPYNQWHPFDGIWIGTNCLFLGDVGSVPLVTRTGRILVPAQMTCAGPDGKLLNPTGALTYTDALVLIGTWTNGHRLSWKMSQRVAGDPKRSTRGMIEPTLAQFPDGRILMVLRGSNGGPTDPKFHLPGYKWFSVSRDDGETWSQPEPWTFEDGQPFFSPSAMSALFHHSSGRVFWAGNLAAENCRGNSPRWPLVIGEVRATDLKLIRARVLVVDTEQPEDKPQGRLDLSHFTLIEDRETKDVVLVYPRSHHAYQSREWATVRLAVR
jgi:hypothetical protein